MVLVNYKETNLARGTLQASINTLATTFVLDAGQGDLLPSVFPFILKIEQYDNTSTLEIKPVLKRELVLCTNRVGDIITVIRGYESCPASDTALTQTNTVFDFNDGDSVLHVETAGTQKDLKDELVRLETDKLDILDYISGDKLFRDSTTGTDAYQVTIPEITSYAQIDGQMLRVRVDVANSGSASLEVNTLGALPITKFQGDSLQTGDVKAGQIMVVVLDNVGSEWEIVQTVNQSTSVIVEKFQKEVVLGEDITAGDGQGAVFYGKQEIITKTGTSTVFNIGQTSGDILFISNRLENNIIQKREIDGFTTVGNPSDLTITLIGIKNINKTLSLTQAQATSTFDIAVLYKTLYGEWLIGDGQVVAKIEIDTVSATDYYRNLTDTTTATENKADGNDNTGTTRTKLSALSVIINLSNYNGDTALFLDGEFGETAAGNPYDIKVEINGEVLFTDNISTTGFTIKKYSLGKNVKNGDEVEFYYRAISGGALQRQNVYYTFGILETNQILWDGLENNKVWLSDTKFTDTTKCDGIMLESGLVGETKKMQFDGELLQTITYPGEGYILWDKEETKYLKEYTNNNTTYEEIGKITGIVGTLDTVDFEFRKVNGTASHTMSWRILKNGVQLDEITSSTTSTLWIPQTSTLNDTAVYTDIYTIECKSDSSSFYRGAKNHYLNITGKQFITSPKWNNNNMNNGLYLIGKGDTTTEIRLMINEMNFEEIYLSEKEDGTVFNPPSNPGSTTVSSTIEYTPTKTGRLHIALSYTINQRSGGNSSAQFSVDGLVISNVNSDSNWTEFNKKDTLLIPMKKGQTYTLEISTNRSDNNGSNIINASSILNKFISL